PERDNSESAVEHGLANRNSASGGKEQGSNRQNGAGNSNVKSRRSPSARPIGSTDRNGVQNPDAPTQRCHQVEDEHAGHDGGNAPTDGSLHLRHDLQKERHGPQPAKVRETIGRRGGAVSNGKRSFRIGSSQKSGAAPSPPHLSREVESRATGDKHS